VVFNEAPFAFRYPVGAVDAATVITVPGGVLKYPPLRSVTEDAVIIPAEKPPKPFLCIIVFGTLLLIPPTVAAVRYVVESKVPSAFKN
jgi:hypothetical protein